MFGRRFSFSIQNLRQKLWIKPLGFAVMAVVAVFAAHLADAMPLQHIVPQIDADTIEKLLTVISASMLGVATFAVTSMVSAYSSAESSATPRAFALIISDGFSQTALSSFMGAFIFSIVGIISIKIGYFSTAGRFVIFVLTIANFAWVVLTFVRWVDHIARLGRLGNTIKKVDEATRAAFDHWHHSAPLGGRPFSNVPEGGVDLCSDELGFIQHINTERLEKWAKAHDAAIYLQCLTGTFIHARQPLLTVRRLSGDADFEIKDLRKVFVLADRRTFSSDPHFGLIVLSEIGSRALSPGVNDPGTAIEIAVRMARIIHDWSICHKGETRPQPELERVYVRPLDANELLEDGFSAISKDGASSVEVGIWMQKSLALLLQTDDPDLRNAAMKHARLAFDRATQALTFAHDLERVRGAHSAFLKLASARPPAVSAYHPATGPRMPSSG